MFPIKVDKHVRNSFLFGNYLITQGFIFDKHLRNIWCSSCLEAQRWRENTAKEKGVVNVKYSQYRRKNTVERISEEDRKRILCPEYRTGKKQPWWNQRVAVCPIQGEVQQSSVQTGIPRSTAKKEGTERDIRWTFKMLREVWLNIGVEKVDTHEGVIVKALLDSGATGMFMDKKMAARHRFGLQKLERLVIVKNVDSTNNSGVTIIYQVEVNVYYKNHIERMRMDICNPGKTNVILDILWLQVYNPEINQKTEEVKITRCLPLCERNTKLKEEKKVKKRR